MPFGYQGKVLHVNLTTQTIHVDQPEEDFYRKYMGGSALGLYYLFHYTPANADPLGPENTLVIADSVLTGAPISGLSRVSAVAKSPLTGAVGDSQGGGFFPAEMKFSGFDAIVLTGRAEFPVYLRIQDGRAELRPADHLWGRTTGEVEDLLHKELADERVQILQCGQAGERLVRFASLISMSNRANGRTGMGAVMGSKNLKAVAVRGHNKPPLADRKEALCIAKWGSDHFEDSGIYGLGLFGTGDLIAPHNSSGGLPSRNWESGVFEGALALDGKTMAQTILKKRDTCYACTVRCKRVVEVLEGPYKVNPRYGGPEYETLATFGSYCGINDLQAVAYANQLCCMYGIDTISCGATIAWAMDCFEHGILTEQDTDGVQIRFGNADGMIQMVEKIAHRQGFGDLLAEGSARAAKLVGKGAEKLVVAVKNLELPAHMPQLKRSLALIYAVNPFGADHQSHGHDPIYRDFPEKMAEIGLTNPQPNDVLNQEKVRFTLITQYVYSCLDSLNICQFVFGPAWQLYGLSQLVEAFKAITGWEIDIDELLQVGERRLNMLRSYNMREGIGREVDTLPEKLTKPLVGGKSEGLLVTNEEVEKAKDWYYTLAGWDVSTGYPSRAKLESLGLSWLADKLNI
jgi:aldehyde:ferredoxin oxidoreductase